MGGCGGNCACSGGAAMSAQKGTCAAGGDKVVLNESGKCPCGKPASKCCHKDSISTNETNEALGELCNPSNKDGLCGDGHAAH